MARDEQKVGACSKCGAAGLVCRHNHFEKEDLRIDSWEHRCVNCGYRETRAFRSDEREEDSSADPLVCPYCGRRSQAAGA